MSAFHDQNAFSIKHKKSYWRVLYTFASPHIHDVQIARITVMGMHCSSCSNAVETALRNIPGVSSAIVSLTMEQAEVEYDSALTSQV